MLDLFLVFLTAAAEGYAQNGARPRLDANACSFRTGGAARALCASVQAAKPDGMMRIPLLFEENRGQGADAAYVVRAGAAEVGFGSAITYRGSGGLYRVEFAGANPKVRATGEQRQAAHVNYYRGAMRAEGVPVFGSLRYRGLYAGIDLLYHGKNGELEYDFQVAPGANPRAIVLRFSSEARLRLMPDGDLEVRSGKETMRHKRPVAYQEIAGHRRDVPAWFRLDGNTVGFTVAPYERRHALTIDPVLKFSTSFLTSISGLASDPNGNTFIALATQNAYPYSGADPDVQYLKLDTAGKLIYKTVVGGLGIETNSGIVADSQGNLFSTGTSSSANYPVNGATCSAIAADAYITKLSPTGALVASRCYGGAYAETVAGIGIDNAGAVYVAGSTESTDLPVTSPVVQSQKRRVNSTLGYVAKFDNGNLSLVYSTYFGNLADVTVLGIAVDAGGSVVVGGKTSPQGFPLTAGAYYTTPVAGPSQGFLAKINAAGNGLVYATLLPSTDINDKLLFGVDEGGQVYVLQIGPTSFGGYTPYTPWRVVRLNAQGTASTMDKVLPFLYGPSAISVDRSGSMLIASQDTSAVAPTADALQVRQSSSAANLALKLDNAANVQYASPLPALTRLVRIAGNDILVALESIFLNDKSFPTTPGTYTDLTEPYFSSGNGVFRMSVPGGCTPELQAGTSLTIPVAGASGTLQVRAPDNCTWVAMVGAYSSSWLQITGARSGTGNGTLNYLAYPLSGSEPGRVATLFLSAANSYDFQQGQPPACQLTNPPQGVFSLQASPAFFAFQLSLPDGCAWTVSPNAAWIRTLGASSGKGTATVNFEAAANDGLARTGTILVAGQNIIVNQEACSYQLTNFGSLTGLAQIMPVSAIAPLGCNWNISSDSSWLQFDVPSSATRSGGAQLTMTVQQNPSSSARSAIVTMGPRQFTLTQQGLACPFTLSTANAIVPSGGGAASVQATSNSTCLISASFSSTAVSGYGGVISGSSTLNFNVSANTASVPRGFLVKGVNIGQSATNQEIAVPFLQDGVNVPQPFTDVPVGHTFFNHIAILKNRNVTRGCSFDGQRYCLSDTVTRADMASFLMRAMSLAAPGGSSFTSSAPYFDDVPPTHPAYLAIQAIRAAGITFGCTAIPSNYCPDTPLTRGQMAALIVRAKVQSDNFAYNGTPYFTDVPATHPFFRHIQKLRDLGVTLGCTTTTFCPDAPNTRGEMAAFIVRAFLSQ
ncbi:MAG: S-layer homology domain-containing protein [Acidobacteria bacterium]|nr:S-layer homology domain-containing protein [Acidobacteriota bacterium]